MEQIKSAIEALIEQLSHKKGAAGESEFEKIIKKLLTKEELKHIKLNNFKNGVLSIKVDSSAWIYKINLRKIELLSSIKQENPEVKNLRFYLGEVK